MLKEVSAGGGASRFDFSPFRDRSNTPQGWREAHAAFWEQYESPRFEDGANVRWQESTGLAPQDSRFTLIVPIHNEQRFLPDALGALMFSDLPSDVNVNIVLATNACSDRSGAIVDGFMRGVGSVEEVPFDDALRTKLDDKGLDTTFKRATVGNITIMHVNTTTPGKANAMNLGNALAIESGHAIAMSVDANNFLEPEALRNMFGEAHKTIVDNPDGTAVVTGNDKHVMPPSMAHRIKKIIKRNSEGVGVAGESKLNGWFNAWDTGFVAEIGGIPQVASEDYALGVAIRRAGRSFHCASGATVWGYEANSVKERISLYARAVRGRLQMLEQDPSAELETLIREDAEYMRPLKERVKGLYERAVQNKKRAPFLAIKFLMYERGIQKGRKDFERDPQNHSWESVGSTK